MKQFTSLERAVVWQSIKRPILRYPIAGNSSRPAGNIAWIQRCAVTDISVEET